jgi:hypothetical protein
MMKLDDVVKKISRPVWIGLGLFLLGGVAILDHMTGVELSFSLFYFSFR